MRALTLLMLLAGSAVAADAPLIRLPVGPAPKSEPMPGVATKLSKGTRYVIACKVPCDVVTFPSGRVAVEEKAGPRDWTAVFADGTGDYEDRTYPEPHLYALKAVGTGPVEVVVIPRGYKDKSEWVRVTLEVDGGGPRPPPDPDPKPEPSSSPFPLPGFRALIVFETGSVIPAGQHSAIYGKTVRDYLETHCVPGPDGRTREYRIYDQNTDTKAESKTWQDAMALRRDSVPWLIVGNGKTGFSGPLPATVAETMTLLRKHGGE